MTDAPAPFPDEPWRAAMPPLDMTGPPLSFYEFWPMSVFYAPILLYALGLMAWYRSWTLPSVANPSFPGGGFYGESKSAILDLALGNPAAARWTAPYIAHDRPIVPLLAPGLSEEAALEQEGAALLARLAAAGLALPVVAKPDIGCRGAGVRPVRTPAELAAYLRHFPAGARLLLQRYIDVEGEAGVFYVREPGQARGQIISLTLKYFPRVVGDGRRSLRQLILDDPRAGRAPQLYWARHRERLDETIPAGEAVRLAFSGSHSKGAIFRDGSRFISPALAARFDAIAQAIPEFYFGRFDVRFASFDRFVAGEDFSIVEVNGAGAEMTHIWDRRTPLLAAWRCLAEQYRLLFRIGAANRARGFRPIGAKAFWRLYQREKTLTPLYPPTA
jgi:hypothetical protein